MRKNFFSIEKLWKFFQLYEIFIYMKVFIYTNVLYGRPTLVHPLLTSSSLLL